MGKKNSNVIVNSKRSRMSAEALAVLPRPDFPLSPHLPTGRWYKVVRGKRHYFGKLADHEAALKAYLLVKDELEAGLTPTAWNADTSRSVADVFNLWLSAKSDALQAGDIVPRTFADYHATAEAASRVLRPETRVKHLRAEDFRKLGDRFKADLSPAVAGRSITITRMAFKWAYEAGHLPEPMRFGPDFKLPKRAERRIASRSRGKGTFTPTQVRALLNAARDGVSDKGGTDGVRASATLYAILLLGINCGMTQREVSGLTLADLHLDDAMLDMIRSKTGIQRTAALWGETVGAIRDSLKEQERTKAKPDELVFLTRKGLPWVRENLEQTATAAGKIKPKLTRIDSISLQFGKLCRVTGVEVEGAGFGHLRHTFRTVADGAGDVHAAMRAMGHELPGINAAYVRDVSAARLRLVADHVHKWLYGAGGAA